MLTLMQLIVGWVGDVLVMLFLSLLLLIRWNVLFNRLLIAVLSRNFVKATIGVIVSLKLITPKLILRRNNHVKRIICVVLFHELLIYICGNGMVGDKYIPFYPIIQP